MTLEFHKLTNQIEQMGQSLANKQEDLESKIALALQIIEAHADPAFLPYILERVQEAVEKDAGYRGARPLDEPIMQAYPPAELPESGTIVATDGSQILPQTHGAALFYLLNIGTIVVRHGSGQPPDIISQPSLFYEDEYMNSQGEKISNATVSARRTIYEMQAMAEYGWKQRDEARPLVLLFDGQLLLYPMSNEVPERDDLVRLYLAAMQRLEEIKASLAGYVDRPRGSILVRMLHLLDIQKEEVSRSSLSTSGRLEGLHDIKLCERFLQPGERTALFIQMSPQNKEFKKSGGEGLEIAFFYLNVSAPGEPPRLARVEIPMWVARDRVAVAEMQALIYHQCQQLMTRYPYALMRADELAVVKTDESRQLSLLIQVAMTRYGLDTLESEKQSGKNAARSGKTRFKVAS